MKIFISGQKYFGERVFMDCLNAGHEVVGVCTPFTDRYLRPTALKMGVPVIDAGSLNYNSCPKGFDLGITAHSFDYIGKKTRYVPKHGWIGYHPSLLPRHRGRSAIEWAVRMGDFITGGSVYWLNAGVDRGDIERQGYTWVDRKYFAMEPREAARIIWADHLMPMGLKLLSGAVADISAGVINKTPQDGRFSTFEPSLDIKDIFRPDLLTLPEGINKLATV